MSIIRKQFLHPQNGGLLPHETGRFHSREQIPIGMPLRSFKWWIQSVTVCNREFLWNYLICGNLIPWHDIAGKSHFTEVVSSRFCFVESIESIAFTQAPSSTFGLGHLILTSYRTKTKGFHRLFKFQAVKHFMFCPFRTGQVFSIYCTFLDPWSIWSFDRIFKLIVLLWMVLRFVVLVLFFLGPLRVIHQVELLWRKSDGGQRVMRHHSDFFSVSWLLT